MQQQILTTIDLNELVDLIASKVAEKILQNQPRVDKEKLITAKEVCLLLRISLPTLYQRCKEGSINKYRVGNRILFKENEIVASLKTFRKYKV